MDIEKSKPLGKVLYRLLLWRLFVPLVVLSFVSLGLAVYLGGQSLRVQQQQLTNSLAYRVDDYLNHAGRILDAVARVAETSDAENLVTYMQSTWEAYGYFETLYYLDEQGIVTLLVPLKPQYQRYLGLDMSYQPYFQNRLEASEIAISSPFNSFSTGQPTVYITRALADGKAIVGTLNLEVLQTSMSEDRQSVPGQGSIFITDNAGTFLANTYRPDWVKQQENIGDLEIVSRGLKQETSLFYTFEGQLVSGCAAPVREVDWVVVHQIPVFEIYSLYIGTFGLILFLSLLLWLALVWTLRSQLDRHVVDPLARLSQVTAALALGDFAQVDKLAHMPVAFAEVDALRHDFQLMSEAIHARQAALRHSEKRYRILYEVSHSLVGVPNLEKISQAAFLVIPSIGAHQGIMVLLDGQRPDQLYSTLQAYKHFSKEQVQTFAQRLMALNQTESTVPQRQAFLIQDTQTSPQWVELLAVESQITPRAVICVPLLAREDKTTGFLIYTHAEALAFGQEELELVEEIAIRVSMALENLQLYEQTRQEIKERQQAEARVQRLLDQQVAVNRLAFALGETRNLERIYRTIYRHVRSLMDVNAFVVSFYDQETKHIHAGYVVNNDVPLDASVLAPIPLEEPGLGPQSRVIHTGRPFYVPDLVKALRTTPTDRKSGDDVEEEGLVFSKSAVFIPMKIEGQTQGVMQVQSRRLDAYTQEDIDLLSALANVAAVAIQNARLFRDIQQSARRLQALYETSRALSSSLDEEALIRVILERIYHTLGCEHVILSIVDEEARTIGIRHGVWLGEFDVFPEWMEMSRYSLDHPDILCDVYRTGKTEIIEAWDARFNREIWDRFAHERLQRIFMPIKLGRRVIGVFEVGYSKGEHGHITEEEVQTLAAFVDHAAIVLENARLFQAEREQREFAEALAEAAAIVNSTLDLEDVLDRILERAERVVPGDAFSVMLIQDGLARLVRSRGYERLGMEEQVRNFLLPIIEYNNLLTIQEGHPVIVANTHTHPDWQLLDGWEKIHSYLGVPVQVKGNTVGLLSVEGINIGQFSATDMRHLEAFASPAATAIENAQLFQQLRDHAKELEARVEERTLELQTQYVWLDAILRSVSDGIIVVDTVGEILQVNPVAETWLKQSLTPEEAKLLYATVRQLAQRAFERPETALELTGLDLLLNAAPIAEPGLEQVAVVVVHDVSHLKALDRMKSQFVSDVSHELRTPVTTIKLYAELLQNCAAEKRPEYLKALLQEADRQAHLIQDILQISRIDAGRLVLKPRPTSLEHLVEQVVEHHKILAQARNIVLKTQAPQSVPPILIDPKRIMQVLNNLVENAIRYTLKGGQVVISLDKAEAKERLWTIVRIKDSGMGIPEQEIPHIFERFFRGGKPRQLQMPGTGLGLTIVKEIVELHGGWVTVESQLNKGSVFTVWLPIAE